MLAVTSGSSVATIATMRTKAVFFRADRRVIATPASPTASANPQRQRRHPQLVDQGNRQLRLDAQTAERQHAIRLRRRLHHVDLQTGHAQQAPRGRLGTLEILAGFGVACPSARPRRLITAY